MSIPLIDLGPWFHGSHADRQRLARDVDRHLQDVGFLVVTGHELDAAMLDGLRATVREFFALPYEVKQQYRNEGPLYRGWFPMGSESNAAAYGVATAPDLKETFACAPVDLTPELIAAAPQFYGETVWPAEVPELRPLHEAFARASNELVNELLTLLGCALGTPPAEMLECCRHPMVNASLNWYPSRRSLEIPVTDEQYRIGPHTDYGTVTVLDRQPGLGGLEVCVDGEWETAPWVEGSVTINTGLLMQRWSNDRWTANKHRVLAPPDGDPDEELVSLIYFHEADYDAVITPLAGCCSNDNPPRYEPVIAADHFAGLLDAIVVGP